MRWCQAQSSGGHGDDGVVDEVDDSFDGDFSDVEDDGIVLVFVLVWRLCVCCSYNLLLRVVSLRLLSPFFWAMCVQTTRTTTRSTTRTLQWTMPRDRVGALPTE